MTLKKYMEEYGITDVKEAIIEMAIDFMARRDEEIHQSDYLIACYEYGFEVGEIEEIASKKATEILSR